MKRPINIQKLLISKSAINLFFTLLFFFLSNSYCNAQGKEANIWYFGVNAGITFSTTPPSSLSNSQMNTWEGCASISNNQGQLLFYTDGIKVWNANHQIMPNGQGLLGHPSATQSGVIVPHPSDTNLYYLFTVPAEADLDGLRYNLIDMSLSSGLGNIVGGMKNKYLYATTTERITAVRHANNSDIWVITHDWGTSVFRIYLIDDGGLNETPITQSIGSVHDGDTDNTIGYMKVSSDGHKIALAKNEDGILEVFDFNNSTGELSNYVTTLLGEYPGIYGIEFSPDNSKIYFTVSPTKGLYQVQVADLISGQVYEDAIYIAETISSPGALQLGSDGIIYVSCIGQFSLQAVLNPNATDTACNYQEPFIPLDSECYWGLPNFVQSYFFQNDFIWEDSCFGNATRFSIDNTIGIDSVFWNFHDFLNMPYDTSTMLYPEYTFSHEGTFQVSVVIYYDDDTDTIVNSVNIHAVPQPNLGPDTLVCEGTEIILNAGSEEGMYLWSDGSFGQNVYSITTSDTGTYWVRITNSEGCNSTDSIHFDWYDKAVFNEENLVITPTSCGGSSGSITGLQAEGFEPLSFEWYDGDGNMISTNLDITNLSVGNYFLHVTDGHDCPNASEAYTITDAGDILITAVDFSSSHCLLNSGSISIAASSGSGNDFSYSIDNGSNWQSSNLFENLASDNYFVRVNDPSGCETVFENNPMVIENIEGPQITAVNVVAETDYSADGQIDILATIPEGNLNYSIDNGNSFQTNNGLFTGLAAGIYPCMLKDEFGCDTTFTIVIDRVFSQVIDAIAGGGNTCIGDATASQLRLNNFVEVDSFHVILTYDNTLINCDGYMQVHPDLEEGFQASIIPTVGEVQITWKGQSPTTLPENAKMAELVFSTLDEGLSQIKWVAEPDEGQFFNENGEAISVVYKLGAIRIYTRPEIMMGTSKDACEGDTIIISPFVTGGSGEAFYEWNGPDNYYSTNDFLWFSTISPQQAGIYQLTVTDTIDCVESKDIEITVNLSPAIAFSTYDTLWVEPGYLLEAGNGVEYYLWNTGEITEAIQIDSMGHYVVEVISYEGCKSSDAVQILWGGTPFYMPNAFTPNGDGLNDFFGPIPRYDYVNRYHMSIFNRWGHMIFETTDINKGWDGTYNGSPCMLGAYVYRIVYEEFGQLPIESNVVEGTVMLVR